MESQPTFGSSLPKSSDSGKEPIFVCSYCKRKFPTSHALGGHINAHRMERLEERRERRNQSAKKLIPIAPSPVPPSTSCWGSSAPGRSGLPPFNYYMSAHRPTGPMVRAPPERRRLGMTQYMMTPLHWVRETNAIAEGELELTLRPPEFGQPNDVGPSLNPNQLDLNLGPPGNGKDLDLTLKL